MILVELQPPGFEIPDGAGGFTLAPNPNTQTAYAERAEGSADEVLLEGTALIPKKQTTFRVPLTGREHINTNWTLKTLPRVGDPERFNIRSVTREAVPGGGLDSVLALGCEAVPC